MSPFHEALSLNETWQSVVVTEICRGQEQQMTCGEHLASWIPLRNLTVCVDIILQLQYWLIKASATVCRTHLMLVLFTICPVCSDLPCPWEQPEQVLMATQFRSKLTKVVLETVSSHLLGVLIPADIHRLPCEFFKNRKINRETK